MDCACWSRIRATGHAVEQARMRAGEQGTRACLAGLRSRARVLVPVAEFPNKREGGGIRCRKSRNNFMHHLKTVHVPVQGTFPANVPAEEKGHAFPRMSITHLTSRRLRDLPATSRFRDLPIAGPTCSPAQKDRRFRALPIAGPTRSPAG